MATNFYKDLFKDTNTCIPFCLIGSFPTIEEASVETRPSQT